MKKVIGESMLPISIKNRYANSLMLFWLWAGGNVLLATFMVGSYYAESLGLIPMIIASIFANLAAYTLCAWSAQRSAKYGIDEMVSIRPTFGYRGSLFGVVILVGINFGWIGILAAMTGSATQTVVATMTGGFSFTGDFSVYALSGGIIIPLVLLLFNPKIGFWLAKISVPILMLFTIYILIKLLSGGYWAQMSEVQPTYETGWAFAFEACVAFAVAWQPYLGAWNKFAKSERGAFWGTYLGLGLIGILFGIIGGFATLITGQIDPSIWAVELNLGLSALFIIILGTITSAALLLYGGIMAVMSVFPKWNYHLIATVLAVPSIFLVYAGTLQEIFSLILIFVGFLAGPYWAVVMADYFFLRKQRIDVKECFNPYGKYRYFKGFNPVAIGAQIMGMVLWIYLGGWLSGFESLTYLSGMNLFDYVSVTLPSMIVSGLIYIVAAKYVFSRYQCGDYEFISSGKEVVNQNEALDRTI